MEMTKGFWRHRCAAASKNDEELETGVKKVSDFQLLMCFEVRRVPK